MNRYTLIVDGNYFLHKTLFISGKIKRNGQLNFIDEPEKDSDLLASKLATDFAYEVRRFSPILDGVVYCIDSSSWRKDFYPTTNALDTASSTTYKGTRKKDNTINWKAIYDLHDKFAASLKEQGITISRVDGAEADDLIFAWSSYLNMNNRNALIFSGDNDLIQLVCNNEANGTNTLYYNKFAKTMYTFENFDNWLSSTDVESVDIFNQPLDLTSNTKLALQNVLRGIKIKEMNTLEFVFKKILIGDSGDNVSPLYQFRKTSKDGKTRVFNITDNKATKVLNEYEKDNGTISESTFFSSNSISDICQIAKTQLKINDRTLDQLIDKYETNRNLMYLHNRALPPAIMNAMLESIESSGYETIRNMSQINKENILKPITNDEKNLNQTQESSFFGGLNLD
jgi:5'-3' exonuclease